jgi:hypothetical protein
MQNNGDDIFTDIIQRLKNLEIARTRLNQEEARLLHRLEVENARRLTQTPGAHNAPAFFEVNDRVQITNAFRIPKAWNNERV